MSYRKKRDHEVSSPPTTGIDPLQERPLNVEPLWSDKQAAAYLNLSPKTLRNRRVSRTNEIPYLKLGVCVRHRPSDVVHYAETRVRLSTSDTGGMSTAVALPSLGDRPEMMRRRDKERPGPISARCGKTFDDGGSDVE